MKLFTNSFVQIILVVLHLTILLITAHPIKDEEYLDSTESDECPPNKFFHLHGKQCVPYNCPKSKPLRDSRTGLCKTKYVPQGDEMGYSRTGWPIGVMGFYQPRGLSLDPMRHTKNGAQYKRTDSWNYHHRVIPTYRRG